MPQYEKDFLSWYEFDQRMVTGEFFDPEPVKVESGDHVGIVLLNMGGPDTLDAIKPFLYQLFMDPAIIDIPLPNFLRSPLCSLISYFRSSSKKEEYEKIGGGSPLLEYSRKQASSLEEYLRDQSNGLDFSISTYLAMRYWHPFSEEAANRMEEDDVDKVLLLPLYPHYSKTTTGSSLAFWKFLEEKGKIRSRPTSYVKEYATHPKFIEAFNDRIDEGLDHFPEEERDSVQLLFSAHGTPVKEMLERRDPYCCLVHSTVEQVMEERSHDRKFHTAFQSQVGPQEWLGPSTLEKLEQLGEKGCRSVLVIPIAFTSDHIETDFELDIEAREEAEEYGIEHFEVVEGLNEHPKYIEALAEVTWSQIEFASELQDQVSEGTIPQISSQVERSEFREDDRDIRCIQCDYVTEASCWTKS